MIRAYATQVIVNRTTIGVLVSEQDDVTSRVSATVDDHTWTLELASWTFPSVAVFEHCSVIWALNRAYFFPRGSGPIVVDFDDELNAVYQVDDRFCIIGETSVVLYDLAQRVSVDILEADEVLGQSWWKSDELYVSREGASPLQLVPSRNGLGVRGVPRQ